MKKRIGNDFLFYWIIKENDIVINPDEVLDFKIIIKHRRTGSEIVAEFDVVNSSPKIKCENLLNLGIYDLIATWKVVDATFDDGFRNSSADVQGFEIVTSSSLECETDLTVTSEIAIGYDGLDAYEVWVKNGNEGKTYEEYIAFLQQPATDAAALVEVAIENANEAATDANEKALLAQNAASNADAKATLANDAAILANEKATLANDKAAIAQTAATNANTAASNVNSAILSAGQLGSIKPTDAAPTPARNGQYVFSIGGTKPSWLSAEPLITEVKAGDGVSVVYTAPSTYSYTHIDAYNEIEQVRSQSEFKAPSSKVLDDEFLKLQRQISPYLFTNGVRAYINGTNFVIEKQIQYGYNRNLGTSSGTTTKSITDITNWLGSISNYIFILVKNDGVSGGASTIKFINYADWAAQTEYIPVGAIYNNSGTYYLTYLFGYSITDLIDVIRGTGLSHKAPSSVLFDNELLKIQRQLVPFYYYNKVNIYVSGTTINIYNQMQFGYSRFFGRYGNTTSWDMSSAANWIGSITATFFILLKNDGTVSAGSTVKFCDTSGWSTQTDYIPIGSVYFDGTNYNINYIQGYQKSDFLPYQATPIRFQIPVNCNIADYLSNTDDLQDDELIYNDWGVLILPTTYLSHGAKTKFIVSCHGAGGSVTASSSTLENSVLYRYLCANGYAVMDMNGLPESFAALKGIDINNNVGSPIALQSYLKGYEYVTKNYNLDKEVIVIGGSMGGLTSSNLVQSNSIKVKAHAAYCPVVDTYNQAFLNPWSGGLSKEALGLIYNFEKDGLNEYIYDAEKLKGFNPVLNGLVTVGTDEFKNYPCPLKIWHSQNDSVVSIVSSQRHVLSLRNMGKNAVLRTVPTGDHDPLTAGNVLASPHGSTNYKGTTLSIYPIMEEIYLFVKKYT